MSRFYLCVIAWLIALTASAGYTSMEFKTSDGASHRIGADGLIITVSGENLIAANSSNELLELPLTSVVSMQFTEFSTSVAEVVSMVNGPVAVYTINGAIVGHFSSASKAWNTLTQGFYLLKDNKGKTIKIVISK